MPEQGVLYRAVQAELETFLERAADRDRLIPRFVERELRGFLTCGLLCHGFARVRCKACGKDRLVAFSCKRRGFCPSCGGRRMADTAAHLVDRVLPEVPVRQWVISFPYPLRVRLAYDRELCGEVLRAFISVVSASLRRRARVDLQGSKLQCGSVTFIQRAGDALNLNPHLHVLFLDGVYAAADTFEKPQFHPLDAPSEAELERIVGIFARRVVKILERRALVDELGFDEEDSFHREEPLLARIYAAAVSGRVGLGARAGKRVLRRGCSTDGGSRDAFEGKCCAALHGFSLHAGVMVPAHDRARLERLCRYVARPPIAMSRLEELPDGRLLYRLKNPWRDGTTHIVFEKNEFMERLVALVPPPRFNLVRYHGCLAPCASWRDVVVRDRRGTGKPPQADTQEAPTSTDSLPGLELLDLALASSAMSILRPRRLAWAELMRRVFKLDVLQCPECNGRMRLIATIDQPEVIRAILGSLAIRARPPPLAPARPSPQTALDLEFAQEFPPSDFA